MYRLEKFSKDLLDSTKMEWINQTSKFGEFGLLLSSDLRKIFNDIEKKHNEIENFHAHFLVENDVGHGCAILDILHAMPHSKDGWLKLLDITLEPNLNQEAKRATTKEDVSRVIGVLGYSIGLSISLIKADSFDTGMLKIYGRTSIMRELFSTLVVDENLSNMITPLGLALRKEGKWLVIEKVV